jgi:hypothetical protein
MRFSWRWGLGTAIALGVLFALLLAPIGLGVTQLAKALENAAHGPLFAALAVGSLLLLRQILPGYSTAMLYALALLIALVLGALSELAQSFTGSREARINDWINDAFGAFAGLSAFAAFDSRLQFRSASKVCVLLLSAFAMAYVFKPVLDAGMSAYQRQMQFPELVTWHTLSGYRVLTASEASGMVTSIPAEWRRSADELALYVQPHATQPAADPDTAPESYPGVTLEEPWPKWSDHRVLIIDIVNPNSADLLMTLRINDRRHNNRFADRFNRRLQIAPRQRTEIVIPLDDIARGPEQRAMDLSAIAKLMLFQDGRRGAQPFYLCGIRLAP